MRSLLLFFTISFHLLWSCNPKSEEQKQDISSNLELGVWRGVLKPQDVEIPFNFELIKSKERFTIELINADERIPLDAIVLDNDSIHIPMYIFDATIHARIEANSILSGVWVKNYAEEYIVPFEAVYGGKERFASQHDGMRASFEGKWEVDFIEKNSVKKAIGLFEQDGNFVTGTFLTPTGDYRFLEGVADGNELKISCFDGTHAYLFEAKLLGDGTIEGDFWSGKTWHQKWTARRNDSFELPDPYSMTFIKEGYDNFEIEFPNTSGEIVELSNAKYKGKVVVIQILGSWCPNCMDETRFYTDWYHRNKDRGIEIIGLAFERKADIDYATSRINQMKEKLGVNYEVLIAGTTSQESRAEALPMLNKLLSFPTSIILDKEHNVRKIHTGFSGPGTGEYYQKFVEDFNLFMDKLISE
jgi:thiol-disulfide isomerase/thioredoxin